MTEPHIASPTICRACLTTWPDGIGASVVPDTPCPQCGLPTLRAHPELFKLETAHIDCDAFYASVEKRDNPELRNKPLLVGGTSGRGVVTTACYIARQYGPRSAMPMFKAMQLCPDAVVVKPDMAKYRAVSDQIRALMLSLTPTIEPLSLDEAYLDLRADVRHDPETSPAVLLAELAKSVRRECGISISIGLAPNKFLAKLASDLDKPRGYAVIGEAEAEHVLADMPVAKIHGVGPQTAKKLESGGITHIHQLQAMADDELRLRFGRFGYRLAQYIRGRDPRVVSSRRKSKSVSAETTFRQDLTSPSDLLAAVSPLCDRVAERLREKHRAGRTVVLKLKTSQFQSLTRNHQLQAPTSRADTLRAVAERLVTREADGRSFRLIGIAVADLVTDSETADPPDLFSQTQSPVRNSDATMPAHKPLNEQDTS
ncbi:MAG: DNA polymerase IV [Pseudomonadota bacterium]